MGACPAERLGGPSEFVTTLEYPQRIHFLVLPRYYTSTDSHSLQYVRQPWLRTIAVAGSWMRSMPAPSISTHAKRALSVETKASHGIGICVTAAMASGSRLMTMRGMRKTVTKRLRDISPS